MESYSLSQCQKIYEDISKTAMFKAITKIPKSDMKEPTPITIQEKLESHAYISVFDFVLDFRMLLSFCKQYFKDNENAGFVADDILKTFNGKINSMPRSPSEMKNMLIENCLKRIHIIRRAMSLSAAGLEQTEDASVALEGEKSYTKLASPKKIESIQAMINVVTDIEILGKVADILKANVPNFEISSTVVLQSKEITKECADKLIEVLSVSPEYIAYQNQELLKSEVNSIETSKKSKKNSKTNDKKNTEQSNTEQNNTEQNNTEQNNTEQNNTEQNNTEQNNTEQNNTEQNNTEQNNSELNNIEQNIQE